MSQELNFPVKQPEDENDFKGWLVYAKSLEKEKEYYKQRLKLITDHEKKDCWYWQGDGNDHLDSMIGGLTVVISAGQLRDLIREKTSC